MANRSKSIDDSVGTRIKQLRTSRNITQKELAEQLYKSESTVRMWELGKSEPDLAMLKTIAEFFSVSADYLLDRNDQVSLESELKIALFGVGTEVTDEMWDKVVDYAKLIKAQHEREIKEIYKNMETAARLRLAMKKKDILTPALSAKTEIKATTIANYIDGKLTPTEKDAAALSAALGISKEWLMNLDDSMPLNVALFQDKTEKVSKQKWNELLEYATILSVIDEDVYRAARSENYDNTEDSLPSQEHLETIVQAPEDYAEPAEQKPQE